MYGDRERARGVVLRKLNTDAICARASAQLGAPFEVAFGPYAAAQTSDGTLVVICHEGVGWEVTDKSPLGLDLYAVVKDAISVVPSFIANLTVEDVLADVTDEPIDLADLVRVHNSRLEDNFWIWHRSLAGALAGS